jgi:ATP-dependent Clp protease adaptor protein ClpS
MTLTREDVLERPHAVADEESTHALVLWNDEVNTFDWVIVCLVEICNHTVEQADQCAHIVHTKGKYAVKHGTFDYLKPYAEALMDRHLSVTIEGN